MILCLLEGFFDLCALMRLDLLEWRTCSIVRQNGGVWRCPCVMQNRTQFCHLKDV